MRIRARVRAMINRRDAELRILTACLNIRPSSSLSERNSIKLYVRDLHVKQANFRHHRLPTLNAKSSAVAYKVYNATENLVLVIKYVVIL